MVITITIQYRADKARIFNAYQEDESKYLAGFLGADLRMFKLPMPDECHLKAWRTGRVVCRWYAAKGTPLYTQILHAFETDVVPAKPSFLDLFIVKVDLQAGYKHSFVWAPSSTSIPKKAQNKTTRFGAGEPLAPGKAPMAPRSTLAARYAASPLARPASTHSETWQRERVDHSVHDLPSTPHHSAAIYGSSSHLQEPSQTRSSFGREYPPLDARASPSAGSSSFTAPDSKSASGAAKAAYKERLLASHRGAGSYTDFPASPAVRAPPGLLVPKVEEDSHEYSLRLSPPTSRPHVPRSPDRPAVPLPHTYTGMSRSSPSSSSAGNPPSSASPAYAAASGATVAALTREMWDVRREMETLRAREASLIQKLERMNGSTESPAPVSGETRAAPVSSEGHRTLQDDVAALRAELEAETAARRAVEVSLQAERHRRERAEGVVEDARRERAAPFVVPSLMDAFLKIAQLSDDVVAGCEAVGLAAR